MIRTSRYGAGKDGFLWQLQLFFFVFSLLILFCLDISQALMVQPFTLVHFFACLLTFFSGPPGPPGVVIVEEITDTTATLSWTRGLDNHSPISTYNLQARSPFSLGWQTVKTGNQ